MSEATLEEIRQDDVLASALHAIESVAVFGAVKSTIRITVDGVDYALSVRRAGLVGL